MQRTQLVITADDLGIDPRRDEGIFAAYATGAITQASLLVGGVSARAAAEEARRVGLPLGLHLDLTEMPPSADADAVASLLDGSGKKLGKHGLRAAVAGGAIDGAHVAREARAQLGAFADLVGEPPRHVDGHQHVHVVPAIAGWLAPVFDAAGVRSVRIPFQREVCFDDSDVQCFYRGVSEEAAIARDMYARFRVRSTEAFAGLDVGGTSSSADRLRAAVRAVPGAVSVELMVHPGFAGHGVDDFNESSDREHELRVLCGLPFSTLPQVQLATFDELALHGGLR